MHDCFHDPAALATFSPEKMNKVNLYESPRMFCDIYCLEPDQVQKDHAHADNDKVYHVLTGTCRIRVGDRTESLSAGKIAVAPAGMVHGLHNDSEQRTTLMVIMAPHPVLEN